jgi:hypothetical protein
MDMIMTHAKIFIAPFKSATTSMGMALQALGYRVMGHRKDLFTDEEYALIQAFNAAVSPFKRPGDVPRAVVEEIIRGLQFVVRAASDHDAFQDWPLGHDCIHPFVKKLLLPEATFIYLDRDRDEWLASVQRWVTARPESHPHCDKTWRFPEAMRVGVAHGQAQLRAAYAALAEEHPGDVLFIDVAELSDSGWARLRDWLQLPASASACGPQFPRANVNPA